LAQSRGVIDIGCDASRRRIARAGGRFGVFLSLHSSLLLAKEQRGRLIIEVESMLGGWYVIGGELLGGNGIENVGEL
jgi:hypothetical protein